MAGAGVRLELGLRLGLGGSRGLVGAGAWWEQGLGALAKAEAV